MTLEKQTPIEIIAMSGMDIIEIYWKHHDSTYHVSPGSFEAQTPLGHDAAIAMIDFKAQYTLFMITAIGRQERRNRKLRYHAEAMINALETMKAYQDSINDDGNETMTCIRINNVLETIQDAIQKLK